MTCYHPLKAFRTPTGVVFSELSRYDIIGRCEIPCGKCLGCRERKARDWSARCLHEAQLWPVNSFITLTYGRGNLPPGSSLDHRDFQLFMKRLRKIIPQVRFFMCGEYGPLNLRPHYHALLFNVSFSDRIPAGKSGAGAVFFSSATLDSCWKLGICTVQDVNPATVSYCTRYIIDKVKRDDADELYSSIDDDGVITVRKPEYCAASLKPGIGAAWFRLYGRDVFPHDYVVIEGHKYPVPRYYDKLKRRIDPSVAIDAIEYARQLRARAAFADSTPERLQVREVVHKARVSTLRRDSIGESDS